MSLPTRPDLSEALAVAGDAGVMVCVQDQNGLITRANATMCRVLECTEAQALGRDWYKHFIAPAERESRRERFNRWMADGEADAGLEVISVLTSESGVEHLVIWAISTLRDDGGKVLGLQRMGVSLTELVLAKAQVHQAARAARREESRARKYLDIAGSIIYAIGIDEKITILNRAGCRLLECTEQEAVGRNWFDAVVPAEEREPRRARFRAWMRGEEAIPGEVKSRVLSLKGNERYARWQVAPLQDDDGKLIGILSSGQDLTRQRDTEKQLQQAQKMEAVGQLTSGIAHDFNNILTVVIGHLELALADVAPRSQLNDTLCTALEAAQRGADLNTQLLTFSRNRVVESRVWNVNDILQEMSGLLRRSLGEGVDIVTDLSGVPCTAELDRAELESAILNLALNSRDASHGRCRLVIETGIINASEVCESAAPDAAMVRVSVADNGPGMTPDELERALDPFFTTKGSGDHSGLGLSMVFRFVERSGGQMELESNLGRGTRVHLYFPVCEGMAETESATSSPEIQSKSEKASVLVVEDQPDVMATVCRFLSVLGYAARFTADHGEAAIDILDSSGHEIDIVLSDIMLPGEIDGIQIVRHARQDIPGIRTVLMSGNPGLASGNDAEFEENLFLRKPFRMSELAQALEDAMKLEPVAESQ